MKRKLLVVDDEAFNRDFLEMHLQEEYFVDKAENGLRALDKMDANVYSAVLLDINMPEMGGLQVLDALGQKGALERTPVIVITGEASDAVENECLEHGAMDFIPKPINVNILKKRVAHIADVFELKNRFAETVDEQTETLRLKNEELGLQTRQLREQAALLLEQKAELESRTQKLRRSNKQIIDVLGTVVEYRDVESGEHIQRVREYTSVLAKSVMEHYPECGLTDKRIALIESASPLHDIGKIAIPDHILLKPGRLTAEEFEVMKTHSVKGCEILDSIKDFLSGEYRKICYDICRYHHERYDGGGYPDHLSGDDIPLAAQLVSVADVYDALVNKRSYKEAYPKDKAFRMIFDGECGAFSPMILTSFAFVKSEFEKIADRRVGMSEAEDELDADEVFGDSGDRFLEQISHEIRTPLNVIIGLAGLAKEEVIDSKKAFNYLSNIEDDSRILLNLVNDIVDISSIENGKLLIRNAKFDLKEQITGLGLSFYEQAKQKNIRFDIHVRGVSEEYVIGDELRLGQMLTNIVSNALRFTSDGGKVNLIVQQGSVTRDLVHMRFIVEDDGAGFDQEMLRSIVSPDFLSGGSANGTQGEVGLGMYISKQLSELMGGVLLVESEVGTGTKVTVDVPFIRTEQRKQEKFYRLIDQRILLVAETERQCKERGDIMVDMGLGYDFAVTMKETLTKIEMMEEAGHPYKICMIDWDPSNINALKLVEEIRTTFGNGLTIILTVPNAAKNKDEGLDAGADFVIENTLFSSIIFDTLIAIEHGECMRQTDDDRSLSSFDFTGKRVLVAEDVALNMEVIVKTLSRVNASVVCVEDGLEALETFKRKPVGFFDCILMDVNMPVMDGCEAVANIRKLNRADAKIIPILGMTANAFPSDVSKVLDSGMTGHVSKPVDAKNLCRLLEGFFYDRGVLSSGEAMRSEAAYLQQENTLLRKRAETDPLTGLLNRFAYEQRTLAMVGSPEEVAFMLLDIDHFKDVNDKYGHLVGDQVLVEVAEVIKRRFRASDHLVRLGGDEFVAIMTRVSDADKCMRRIEQINGDLSQLGDGLPAITVSAGVAFSHAGYTHELYYQADKALYHTKRNGRSGCSVFGAY